jgi:hypothetical protein
MVMVYFVKLLVAQEINKLYEDDSLLGIASCSLVQVDRHFQRCQLPHSTSTRPHDAVSQNALIFKLAAVRTSDLTRTILFSITISFRAV